MTTTRRRLLSYLKQAHQRWVSGQQISSQLGITRAAIWKHIQALKDNGHIIESAPRKGYRLKQLADLIAADEIREGLGTRIIGSREIICLSQTDSTNVQAKNLAMQGAPEGTVVVAETQTVSRGRRGRNWFSPAGQNIYTSIILRPTMAPSQAPQITLMTAVVAARALQDTTGLTAEIKWPNDILVADKKIAGILTEISTEMDAVDFIVVGVGINVNIAHEDMPQDIRNIATSVLMECGKRLSRTKLLCAFLRQFESSYVSLQRDGFKPVMTQWRNMSRIIGQPVYVDVLDVRHTGIVENVDDDGVLILRDETGHRHRIFSGDVSRMRKT